MSRPSLIGGIYSDAVRRAIDALDRRLRRAETNVEALQADVTTMQADVTTMQSDLPRGVIAKGTMPGETNFAAGTPSTTVAGTLTGQLYAGRRYRFVTFIRATSHSGGSCSYVIKYRNTIGGAERPWGDTWHQTFDYYYGLIRSELLLDATADETLDIQSVVDTYCGVAGKLYLNGTSAFYIEDVGAW